jgi:hypothetical protein
MKVPAISLTALLFLLCSSTAMAGWVPVAPVADLVITKTVGTNGVCTAQEITVPTGTEVTYCYTATNTGDLALVRHTLTDDVLGTIFGPDAPALLAPGQTGVMTATQTVNASVVNTAQWVATAAAEAANAATVAQVVTATSMATVNVLETGTSACSDGIDNNGNSLVDCADPSCAGERICTEGAPAMGSAGLIAVALALLGLGSFALARRRA